MQRLKVSSNGKFFQTEGGSPFFWLADTAWHLLTRMSRAFTPPTGWTDAALVLDTPPA